MSSRQRIPLIAAIALVVVVALVSTALFARAQSPASIKYGDTVTGSVASGSLSQAYTFDGKADDVITVTMKRTDGDLKPVIKLSYLDDNKQQHALIESVRSADDTTATISKYTLKGDHSYTLTATRQDGADGGTQGKFSLAIAGETKGQSPCVGVQPPVESTGATQEAGPKQWSQPDSVIDPNHIYCAILTTDSGLIIMELYPEVAPKNVNNFVFLAQHEFYDNITWHRVIPQFVAQTGDPTGTGTGGPGYSNIPLEIFTDVKYDREGRVGVARTQVDDSAGSQFFIALVPLPSLDPHSKELPDSDGYTIIGQVVEGMDVANAISPHDPQQDPGKGDALISIRVIDLTAEAAKAASK